MRNCVAAREQGLAKAEAGEGSGDTGTGDQTGTTQQATATGGEGQEVALPLDGSANGTMPSG